MGLGPAKRRNQTRDEAVYIAGSDVNVSRTILRADRDRRRPSSGLIFCDETAGRAPEKYGCDGKDFDHAHVDTPE